MTIRTKTFSDLITHDKDGNELERPRLFGVLGFTYITEKTDSNTVINMADLEASMDAGECEDAEGNVVYNNAIVWLPTLVSKVDDPADREHVSRFRNTSGKYANVPEQTAPTAEDDEPLF